MSRRLAGQNTTEFAILVALVVIVCILVYTMLGDQINRLFSSSCFKVANFKPFGVNYDSSGAYKPAPGELGGKPGAPVVKCNAGKCDIDYGDFVLSGVPEDYGEFIEHTGSSGTTDNLAATIEQIADELEKQGVSDAAGLKDLAKMLKFSANTQKSIEDKAKACKSNPSPNAGQCFINALQTNVTLPSDLTSVLPGYTSLPLWYIPWYLKNGGYSGTVNSDPGKKIEALFNDALSSGNPKFTKSMKGALQEAMISYDDVSNNFLNNFSLPYQYKSTTGSISLNSYDALTKTNNQYNLVNAASVGEATVFDDLLTPKHTTLASNTTERLSNCAASWNNSTVNTACRSGYK